jgi:outer membrane protein
MKKITFLALLSVITFSSIAQNKFGYIDSQELLTLMPERVAAATEVENFAKSLEAQLSSMTAEYQQGVQEYQANEATYTDLVKQDKVTEITGLEQRIQSFQQNAQQALQSKEQELLEPILQKARQAIEDVASEGDYTYIFDKSVGSILYVKESENILDKVKKKLKL